MAAKFRQLQALFPEGDVVAMTERDATVLFYDFDKSINVKVVALERWSLEIYSAVLEYEKKTAVGRACVGLRPLSGGFGVCPTGQRYNQQYVTSYIRDAISGAL